VAIVTFGQHKTIGLLVHGIALCTRRSSNAQAPPCCAASVVGISATLALTAAAVLYTRRARLLRQDVLTLTRVPLSSLPQNHRAAFPSHLALLNICQFMELDDATAQRGPWKDCKMASLPDYLRTLLIPGDFNWRKAVHTLLVHFKMPFLLPVADMLVKGSEDEDEHVDVMGPVGGSPFAFAILREALSPLHLYGISAISQGDCCAACKESIILPVTH
jgi:hypothetical protein